MLSVVGQLTAKMMEGRKLNNTIGPTSCVIQQQLNCYDTEREREREIECDSLEEDSLEQCNFR